MEVLEEALSGSLSYEARRGNIAESGGQNKPAAREMRFMEPP